jgi:hypothetical protein
MFNHLNALATFRGLRVSSMDTEISPPMWLPILFGALITLFCAMLLDIEHSKMHIGLNILLGMFIAIFLFIIILLDHPFAGPSGLKPKSYKEIFIMEQWDQEAKAAKKTTDQQLK